MSCGCNDSGQVTGFNDLLTQNPKDPADLIAYAEIDNGSTEAGVWTLSDDYYQPAGSSVWIGRAINFSAVNTIETNHTDNQQMVFDAQSWNFAHQRTNSVGLNLPDPMQKIAFMRAGLQWVNILPLSMPASPQFTELQLSFLDNVATRGDNRGTVPVYKWSAIGPFATSATLKLVLKMPGRYQLGLLGINNNGTPDYSMNELDIVVL